MAGYTEIDVGFLKVIDQILLYHRESCIDMHIQSGPEVRERMYVKAEAAREIIMLLGKELLASKETKVFQGAMKEKLGSVYQAVFFDPATRNLIKQAREERNGGQE